MSPSHNVIFSRKQSKALKVLRLKMPRKGKWEICVFFDEKNKNRKRYER